MSKPRMHIKLTIDSTGMYKSLKRAPMTEKDLIDILGTGSKIVINTQRELVPTDTAATKNSIDDHIVESSRTKVVDDVGPETNYAPYLEYGTGEFAEGGKGRRGGWFYQDDDGWHFTKGMAPRPFVRPSILKNGADIIRAFTSAYIQILREKWQI